MIDWKWSCLTGTEMLNQQKKERKRAGRCDWCWQEMMSLLLGDGEEEEEEEAAFIPDENDCKLQTSLAHLKKNKQQQPFVCTRNEAYKRFSPVSTQTERWRGSAGTRYFPHVGQKLWNPVTAWGFCCGWIPDWQVSGSAHLRPANCKSKGHGLSPVITSSWPSLRFPRLPVSHRKHPDRPFFFCLILCKHVCPQF